MESPLVLLILNPLLSQVLNLEHLLTQLLHHLPDLLLTTKITIGLLELLQHPLHGQLGLLAAEIILGSSPISTFRLRIRTLIFTQIIYLQLLFLLYKFRHHPVNLLHVHVGHQSDHFPASDIL